MSRISGFLISCLICIISLTGCTSEETSAAEKPLVYTSFYPVYDLVGEIVEDTVDLRSFMPADKDPHLWEPTPKDIKQLSQADILVVNGANMEKWLDKIRETLPNLRILNLSDGVELISYKGAAALGDFQYMASANLDKGKYGIEFGHTHEDVIRFGFYHDKDNLSDSELIDIGKEIMEKKSKLIGQETTIEVESGEVYGIEMGHEFGYINYKIPEKSRWIIYSDRLSEEILSYELLDKDGEKLEREILLQGSTSGLDKITYDPHSWLSLVNAKKYIKDIEVEFSKLYPENKRLYEKNSLKAIEEITDLEYEYKDKLKDVELREFVVTHNAYAYLCRDLDLKQFPLQALTSMESPSLKTIKKALNFCENKNIKTIYYEYGQERKGADTIAYELDGQVLPLVSMEYIRDDQRKSGDTYIDFMRLNLENIYESLR